MTLCTENELGELIYEEIDAKEYFSKKDRRLHYERLKTINRELYLTTKNGYNKKVKENNPYVYVENPNEYFGKRWEGWKIFLGVEFDMSYDEVLSLIKENDIKSFVEYEKYAKEHDLPSDLSVLFPDKIEEIKKEMGKNKKGIRRYRE